VHKHPLVPKFFLDNYKKYFGSTKLEEITNLRIGVLSIPINSLDNARKLIIKKFDCDLPNISKSIIIEAPKLRILRMTIEQLFFLEFDKINPIIYPIYSGFQSVGYLSDQSDAWVSIRIKGEKVIPALERICTIDISYPGFPENSVARTQMEHLSVIIIRESLDGFLMMSASSSAGSFLEMLEVSLEQVI